MQKKIVDFQFWRAVWPEVLLLLAAAVTFAFVLVAPLAFAEGLPLTVEEARLWDAYTRGELIRLHVLADSDGVFGSTSVAAIGVAAHECGHAMQQQEGYGPLKLRSAMVPVVNIGSNLYFPIFLLGLLFSWEPLIYVGIACFSLTLLFGLVTLPVEFNASKRAMAALSDGGYMTGEELDGARAVLNAAAMTYVASVVSSLLQLLRLLIISRNNRD